MGAVRPTFSGAPSIPIRQSDDTFRGLPPEPSRPLTLLFWGYSSNQQTNRLRLYSMIPCCQKSLLSNETIVTCPHWATKKTAKLQLPPPNSLLPYNSYYIIYIQFPVRSGFVVGQIHE